jgi:hypothetical protein
MHGELFKVPTVVARYRAGPYVESREQFLKKARADGYSPATLERIAWALLVVAEIVHRNGGSITPKRLRSALLQSIRPKSLERLPSPHTVKLVLSERGTLAPKHGCVDSRTGTAGEVRKRAVRV